MRTRLAWTSIGRAGRWSRIVLGLASLVLVGCNSLNSANSPDVVYDSNAEEARTLQIPPDLTDVSNTEQFVIPGTGDGPVTRNTLLPSFDSVRFKRDGQLAYLEIDRTPESVWPQLLAFVRAEQFLVDQTQPVTGLIVTQWREALPAESNSLFRNLIDTEEQYTRVAFRLEREGQGARLFVRYQAAGEAVALADNTGEAPWPASASDPEASSELLSKVLVFFGLEEQQARGLLDGQQTSQLLKDAVIETNAAGSELVVYRGFKPAFYSVLNAMNDLDLPIVNSDDNVGRIEFMGQADSGPLVIELSPAHISEVRMALSDTAGRRLAPDEERRLLQALMTSIAQG